MPLGGPYLDAATIDVIRQWITDGATREAAAMAARKPFELVTSAPANGDALGRPPAQLVLAFSRDLDASRIDASQVRLGRLVGGEVVPSNIDFDVATVMSNPRALVVTPRSALTSGRYVLQVEAAALADMQGTPFGPERPGGTSSGVRVVFDVGGTR
jgi:methionine-rich copper-binding protein CopC